MAKHVTVGGALGKLLQGQQIRRAGLEGRTLYAVADLVATLSEPAHADDAWNALAAREPRLRRLVERAAVQDAAGRSEITDVVDLAGALRVVQSIRSPQAERIKRWLIASAVQRVEEMENPELALLRARRLYERHGYARRWIDKRLRGMSARQELTSEWYKRGVTESDQYRALTNELMQRAFGLDVESYRRLKRLREPADNLRDHMSDLELILTMLAETTAATLHRDHDAKGFEELLAGARDAGDVVSHTREDLERRLDRRVVSPERHDEPRPARWQTRPQDRTAVAS